jgi:hypothetical protein
MLERARSGINKNPPPPSQIVTVTAFGIPEIQSFVQGDEVHMPTVFLQLMAEIAVSTTRGVLYERHRGTALHGALIPLAWGGFPDKPTMAFTQDAKVIDWVPTIILGKERPTS